jgi:hypothetical protein
MSITHHKANTCPFCEYVMDASKEVSGKSVSPTVGDYSICFNCTNILIFDEDLSLRRTNEDDEISDETLDMLLEMKFMLNMQKRARQFSEEYNKTLREGSR